MLPPREMSLAVQLSRAPLRYAFPNSVGA